ncbi:regulation of mRNA processing [Halocaridina rubra]|uniref:Regulation of mRNA processing n=1 Tax=Halocaridina rubra TaxID=373956 RepID=A0AAN8X991_HALRR
MALFFNIGRASYLRLSPDVILKSVVSATVFKHRLNDGRGRGTRHLFTEAALGIDSYIYHREKVMLQFQNLQDKFRERMIEILNSENKNLIFTDDLKNAVHLAQANEDDLSLIIEMAKKYVVECH